MSGNSTPSRMKKTGKLVAHQVPVARPGVELDGKPGASPGEPRSWTTVEKRAMTGVRTPGGVHVR
jgi:hypothetical protein